MTTETIKRAMTSVLVAAAVAVGVSGCIFVPYGGYYHEGHRYGGYHHYEHRDGHWG
jgi:hypothetical protein